MSERTYDEDGRPCPNCGNEGEYPIYDAIRQYPELIEVPGFGIVVDVAYRCGSCRWEYGFEYSEPSLQGEPVTMKPYRVVLEIPRNMLTSLMKLCERPEDIGMLINDLVNVACEAADNENSWQGKWLKAAGIGAREPQPVDQGKVDITPEV